MSREEIIRKLEQLDDFIAATDELGCGFTPVEFFEEMEQERAKLIDELERL